MNEKKITNLCNSVTKSLRTRKMSYLDGVTFCAQMLIRLGSASSNGKYPIDDINWDELEKEYYQNSSGNLPLAIILNGGSIMSMIRKHEESIASSEAIDQESQEPLKGV